MRVEILANGERWRHWSPDECRDRRRHRCSRHREWRGPARRSLSAGPRPRPDWSRPARRSFCASRRRRPARYSRRQPSYGRPSPGCQGAERRDLLGKVFRARAAARSAFLDIALVEPPQIVVQPLAGRADELLQSRLGVRRDYLAVLVRLSYLSPEIVRAILAGQQPVELTPARLVALSRVAARLAGAAAVPRICACLTPRKTFAPHTLAFCVSGWRCRDRPKANLRKFRGYSSDCQNQEYEAISGGFVARDLDSNQSMHFICIAFSRRKTRAKLRRARSGEFAARNSMPGEGAPVVIPTRFTKDVRADFKAQNRLDFRRIVRIWCRHGLAEPEPPIKGLALRFAGLWVVRVSSPAPRTNGA